MNVLIVAFLVLSSSLLLIVDNSNSETTKKDSYNTTQPELGKITEEVVYYFEIMNYEPEVKIDFLSNESDARYNTPEAALVSYFSALRQGNYEWGLNTVTNKSRKEFENQDNAEQGWIEWWETFYKDSHIVLFKKIVTGEYTLINFKAVSNFDPNKIILQETLPFVNQNGKWLVTNELSSDPVFLYWQDPTIKPTRVGRELK